MGGFAKILVINWCNNCLLNSGRSSSHLNLKDVQRSPLVSTLTNSRWMSFLWTSSISQSNKQPINKYKTKSSLKKVLVLRVISSMWIWSDLALLQFSTLSRSSSQRLRTLFSSTRSNHGLGWGGFVSPLSRGKLQIPLSSRGSGSSCSTLTVATSSWHVSSLTAICAVGLCTCLTPCRSNTTTVEAFNGPFYLSWMHSTRLTLT